MLKSASLKIHLTARFKTTFSMPKKPTILFLGDCNTLGTPEIQGDAYPEKLGRNIDVDILNCGHTMSTTREGLEYFKAKYDPSIDIICIQYGLVDSWQTFKYSPYVLYYPDSKRRKIGRKLTKKFKKLCKKLGLNKIIGTNNVVPLKEYIQNILTIMQGANNCSIILIDTAPNKDNSRNPDIENYNEALSELAAQHASMFKLSIYHDFATTQQDHYIDPNHISHEGHQFIADSLANLIQTDITTHD